MNKQRQKRIWQVVGDVISQFGKEDLDCIIVVADNNIPFIMKSTMDQVYTWRAINLYRMRMSREIEDLEELYDND